MSTSISVSTPIGRFTRSNFVEWKEGIFHSGIDYYRTEHAFTIDLCDRCGNNFQAFEDLIQNLKKDTAYSGHNCVNGTFLLGLRVPQNCLSYGYESLTEEGYAFFRNIAAEIGEFTILHKQSYFITSEKPVNQ